MGSADRIIRFLAALIIAGLYYADIITGTWAVVLLTLAAVFFLTSVVSFCPLYAPFGIRTCPARKE